MFDTPVQYKPTVFLQVRNLASKLDAQTVREALLALDGRAQVRVDLLDRRIEVRSSWAEPHDLRDAISRVGFATARQWPSELLLN